MNKRRGFKTLQTALKEIAKVSPEHNSFVEMVTPDPMGGYPDMDRYEHAYKQEFMKKLLQYSYDMSTPFVVLIFPRKISIYFRDGDDKMTEFFLSISEGALGSVGKWGVIVPHKENGEWELTPDS